MRDWSVAANIQNWWATRSSKGNQSGDIDQQKWTRTKASERFSQREWCRSTSPNVDVSTKRNHWLTDLLHFFGCLSWQHCYFSMAKINKYLYCKKTLQSQLSLNKYLFGKPVQTSELKLFCPNGSEKNTKNATVTWFTLACQFCTVAAPITACRRVGT